VTQSTYGIEDLNAVISHPAFGSFQLNGAGIVSVTFGRATDTAQQDVAADGSVMTSKISAKNGPVTIVLQQTSDAAMWLTRLFNYLENSPSSEFTRTVISASSKAMGTSHTATGCAPQKMPDSAYGAQGAQETYTFLAAQTEKGVA